MPPRYGSSTRRIELLSAATELLSAGRPYKEILRTADERGADLIVIGVQGRGSADLMLFGSTTQQVVRQATVPVLTLRAR